MIPQTVKFKALSHHGERWFYSTEDQVQVWIKGFAYRNGDLLRHEEFAALLRQHIRSSVSPDVTGLLQELNGHYAVALETTEYLVAAVDRIRSMPLFYSEHDRCFFLSDDPYWIREQTGNEQQDQVAELEFLLTGYVTGAETLCSHIKQLRAGENLVVQKSAQVPHAVLER